MESLKRTEPEPTFLRDETAYTETIHGFDDDERPLETPNGTYVDTSRAQGEFPEGTASPEKPPPVLLTEVRRTRTRTTFDETPNFEPSDESEIELSGDEIDYERRKQYEERASQIESILQQEDLWDTDLEDGTELDAESLQHLHDTSGKWQYRRACQKYGAVPATYFLQHIEDKKLSMRYHGLGSSGTKAVAVALKSNITVEHLDLGNNWMDIEGAMAIGRMLDDNSFVQHLVLADNHLGDEGVRIISQAMRSNASIRHLDLSGNGITDIGAICIADVLENNKTLLELLLCYNEIGSEGAIELSPAISSNDILEYLDLSWNRIRGEGAEELAKGIKENVRIKTCLLGWNGLGSSGAKGLSEMIKENGTILELDLSGNRLDSDMATTIGRALAGNESLQLVRMGFNPINTAGAISLVSQLNNSEVTELKHLDLEDISVEFEFIKIVEHIKEKRPEFTVTYGTELRVGNTAEDLKKNPANYNSPIVLMREHVLIRDSRLIEILDRLDESGRHAVTLDLFIQALDELGMKYLKSQVNEMAEKLDKFGDGTIYFGDFLPPQGPTKEDILGFDDAEKS